MTANQCRILLAAFVFVFAGCDSASEGRGANGDNKDGGALANSSAAATAKAASEAAKTVEALEQMPQKHHVALAGMALSEFAAERLPAKLTEGLKSLGEMDEKMGRMVAASTLTDPAVLKLADEACGKPVAGVMAGVMQSAREDGAKTLWSSCAFDKLGLVDETTALRADAIMLMLAHATYVGLGGTKADPDERTVVRALIGAGPARKPSRLKSLPPRRRR